MAGLELRVISAFRDLFIDARGTFSFVSSATVPVCPELTRERLPNVPLERSCGRRKRSMPNRPNVGTDTRLLPPFELRKCFYLLSDAGETYGLGEGEPGRRRARLLLHAKREGRVASQSQGVRGARRRSI